MYFIGDTHGNLRYIQMLIRDRKIVDSEFIHVGDFGVGFIGSDFELNKLKEINNFFGERGCVLHVFRGNHDDPSYFNGDHIYENLKLHPDYTIINVQGKNILGVGGAISIDRVPRKQSNRDEIKYNSEKRCYWEDEPFVLDREKLDGMRNISLVVTHTAPNFVKPINVDVDGDWPYIVEQFMFDDPNLGGDLVYERSLVTEMYNILKPNNHIEEWYYGHFHDTQYTTVGSITFNMLGINELREYIIDDGFEK